MPPLGSVVTATAAGEAPFSVTLHDPNILDTLAVRWISDYPPFGPGSRALEQRMLPPAADGKPLRAPVKFVANCYLLAGGPTRHQIVVAVSDRDFLPFQANKELPLTTVGENAHLVVGVWSLECR